MKENINNLLCEYKETEKCLNQGLEWLPENDFAKAKLEMVQTIIRDLEGLACRV